MGARLLMGRLIGGDLAANAGWALPSSISMIIAHRLNRRFIATAYHMCIGAAWGHWLRSMAGLGNDLESMP